jgi:Zn-dependent metalloprotease
MRHFPTLLLAVSLFAGSAAFGQSTPWAVKKQRNQDNRRPSFSHQVRNGAKAAVSSSPNARTATLSLPSTPLAAPLQLLGATEEPPHEIWGSLPGATNARPSTDLLGATQEYLGEFRSLMQVADPAQEFQLLRQWKDDQGRQHLRMQQQYNGVPVYASEIIVHADQSNVVQGLNGRYIASPQGLDTTPSISEQGAISTSLDHFRQQGTLRTLSAEQQRLLSYTGPSAELLILPAWEADVPTLAWRVEVRPNTLDYWEIFVDARTGDIIKQTNMTCSFAPKRPAETSAEAHRHHNHAPSAAPFKQLRRSTGSGVDLNGANRTMNIWQLNGGSALIDGSKDMFNSTDNTGIKDLEGVIITYDADRVANFETVTIVNEAGTTFRNPTAVSAHYNASVSYDYFREQHNRLAIDGEGGNILSIINVVNDDGSEMDNAYWNGAYMAYGNGDRTFTPIAGGLDVGGHEMSHGVIGTTAKLVYRDQSGAINEHIADVFGFLIEDEDYRLAEDVVVPTGFYRSGAMRNMADPHNGGKELWDGGWQPNHMDEFFSGPEDNGGVHINSGILNRAFSLMADELGRETVGDIYYDALTKYLTASSQFIDLRRAIIRSAQDRFGATQAQVAANAFDTVGIFDGEAPDDDGGDPDPQPEPEEDDDLPAITGADLFLTVNTDPDDADPDGTPWSLYFVNEDENIFAPISTTPVARKPSVTDDGSLAFFVTEDNNIHAIDLTEFSEQVIDEQELWANISVSRDGKRMAIVTNQERPEIWIADLESEEIAPFELYNPTTQDGIVTYDVQYPDAIEWDYSGEYLLYDAFNRVETFGVGTSEESVIEYWDVNFIRVWDNTENTFADGQITKIFSSLPKGVSIGNPTFSKTNRNIVAFDLFNSEDQSYSIIAADLENGDIKTVYENNTLGFPSYSNDDGALIFDRLDEDDRPIVVQIPLKDNKLEADGQIDTRFYEAQWTSWFSQGTRVINSSENALLNFAIEQPNGSIAGTIEGQTISLDVPSSADITRLRAKFESSDGASVYVGGARQYSGITTNDFSQEVVYSVVAENGEQRNYTVRVAQDGNPPEPQPDPDNPDPDDEVVGVEDEVAKTGTVYPNPFEQEIYLKESLSSQPVTLTLHNVLGQAVPLIRENNHFKVAPSVKPGLYLLTIQHAQGSETVRLIKR